MNLHWNLMIISSIVVVEFAGIQDMLPVWPM
jgi:hypothetical protein